MHTSITLFADDLAKPRPTGNHRDDGQWQVETISHFYPGPAVSVTAYVTAAEAQRIADAWAALAADLAHREAIIADDGRAETIAALSPDAEAYLARAFGDDPRPPRQIGELAREHVAALADIDGRTDVIDPDDDTEYRRHQAAAYGDVIATITGLPS